MKNWKRALAAALSLCLMGTLAACGGGLTEKDVSTTRRTSTWWRT